MVPPTFMAQLQQQADGQGGSPMADEEANLEEDVEQEEEMEEEEMGNEEYNEFDQDRFGHMGDITDDDDEAYY